jgi:hypothetical protein
MRACEVTNLDWVSHVDLEARLSRLFNTHARMCAAPDAARPCGVHRRREPATARTLQVIIIETVRVGRAPSLLVLRH